MNQLTTQELEAIRKRSEQAKVNPFQLGEISVAKRHPYDDVTKLLAEVDRLRVVLTQIDELSDDFYNIESIDGVPTFVLRPDLEDYRDTIHEITVLPYEAINGGD